MEGKKDNCTFCYPDESLEARIINKTDDFITFVSQPRFRRNHILVAPSIHVEKMTELATPERYQILGNIMAEVAIMADMIDEGKGTIIVQKFQPLLQENGIKMNHMHIHAWPRLQEDEDASVPFPAPQNFDNFRKVDEKESRSIMNSGLLLRLRRLPITRPL